MDKTAFDPELLASLTDEERAGLLNPDLVDEGAELDDSDAQAAVEGRDTAKPEPATPAEEPATAPDASAEPAVLPDADTAAAEPEAAEPAAKASILPDWQLPADFKERLGKIEADEASLEQRFDAGELSAAEYRSELRSLTQARGELDRIQLKAEMAEESRAHDHETRKGTWFNDTVPSWLAAHSNYEQGTAAYNALNAEVMRLQGETKGDPFAAGILDQAHANVQRDLRKALGLPPEEAKPSTPQKPQAPARELPPALGGLPNAAPADLDDSSQYALISRLSGTAKEDAMARLSPKEMEEYLASPYA